MADNIRVLDCRVDELAANLNSLDGNWESVVWNFYDRVRKGRCHLCEQGIEHDLAKCHMGIERRVTVVMAKATPQVQMVEIRPDVMKLRRN